MLKIQYCVGNKKLFLNSDNLAFKRGDTDGDLSFNVTTETNTEILYIKYYVEYTNQGRGR